MSNEFQTHFVVHIKFIKKTFAGICEPLCNPDYGKLWYTKPIASHGKYSVGTKAQFGCGYGYQISNINERTCMSNRAWDGQTPPCTLGITS